MKYALQKMLSVADETVDTWKFFFFYKSAFQNISFVLLTIFKKSKCLQCDTDSQNKPCHTLIY